MLGHDAFFLTDALIASMQAHIESTGIAVHLMDRELHILATSCCWPSDRGTGRSDLQAAVIQ